MGVLGVVFLGMNAFASSTTPVYTQFTGGNMNAIEYNASRPKFTTSSAQFNHTFNKAYLINGGEILLDPNDRIDIKIVPTYDPEHLVWSQIKSLKKNTVGTKFIIQQTAVERLGSGVEVRIKSESKQYRPDYTYYMCGNWSPDR